MAVAIAIGALIASVAPLVGMFFVLRQRSGSDYESSLREQLVESREDAKLQRARAETLADENLRLMRKLLENGHRPE